MTSKAETRFGHLSIADSGRENNKRRTLASELIMFIKKSNQAELWEFTRVKLKSSARKCLRSVMRHCIIRSVCGTRMLLQLGKDLSPVSQRREGCTSRFQFEFDKNDLIAVVKRTYIFGQVVHTGITIKCILFIIIIVILLCFVFCLLEKATMPIKNSRSKLNINMLSCSTVQ